jgi:hypothetical protein
MNTPIPALELETDTLRGDLRPSKRPRRPIPCPESRPNCRFGGRR